MTVGHVARSISRVHEHRRAARAEIREHDVSMIPADARGAGVEERCLATRENVAELVRAELTRRHQPLGCSALRRHARQAACFQIKIDEAWYGPPRAGRADGAQLDR